MRCAMLLLVLLVLPVAGWGYTVSASISAPVHQASGYEGWYGGTITWTWGPDVAAVATVDHVSGNWTWQAENTESWYGRWDWTWPDSISTGYELEDSGSFTFVDDSAMWTGDHYDVTVNWLDSSGAVLQTQELTGSSGAGGGGGGDGGGGSVWSDAAGAVSSAVVRVVAVALLGGCLLLVLVLAPGFLRRWVRRAT
jgi:hypothetical protein